MAKTEENSARPVGRPAKISRDAIARAALEIGLDAATLKTIAAHLGVDHSSLYRHIKSRDDIIFAAADHAIATLDWEIETDNWRDYLVAAADAVWDLYQRYPGLAQAIRNMDRTPSAGVRAFSRSCDYLHQHGFSIENAALVVDSIMDMTNDSVSLWQSLNASNEQDEPRIDRLRQTWKASDHDPDGAYKLVIESILNGDPKDWWRKKLNFLIGGAEALLASQS